MQLRQGAHVEASRAQVGNHVYRPAALDLGEGKLRSEIEIFVLRSRELDPLHFPDEFGHIAYRVHPAVITAARMGGPSAHVEGVAVIAPCSFYDLCDRPRVPSFPPRGVYEILFCSPGKW